MSMLLDYTNVAPEAVGALVQLNNYSDKCSISPLLRRLVETVVSQINGCGYCIHVHKQQALELGENQQRLAALENWEDSSEFSELEKAAFAWATNATKLNSTLNSADERDRLFPQLKMHFTDQQIVDLTFIVSAMNAWNRMAISFRHEAPDGA